MLLDPQVRQAFLQDLQEYQMESSHAVVYQYLVYAEQSIIDVFRMYLSDYDATTRFWLWHLRNVNH